MPYFCELPDDPRDYDYARINANKLLPKVEDHVDFSWDSDERLAVANYCLDAAAFADWVSATTCRIDGVPVGRHCYTDGVYVFPEGLAYYIQHHGVKPPQEFIDHALSTPGLGCARYRYAENAVLSARTLGDELLWSQTIETLRLDCFFAVKAKKPGIRVDLPSGLSRGLRDAMRALLTFDIHKMNGDFAYRGSATTIQALVAEYHLADPPSQVRIHHRVLHLIETIEEGLAYLQDLRYSKDYLGVMKKWMKI